MPSCSRNGWPPTPIRGRPADASLAEGVSCDEAGCVAQMPDGAFVALALRPDALPDDCARAALVVTARQPPPACAAAVIDLDRLRRQGALALRRTRDGFAIAAVKPKGVDRPWSPAVAGEDDPELAAPSGCAGGCDAIGEPTSRRRIEGCKPRGAASSIPVWRKNFPIAAIVHVRSFYPRHSLAIGNADAMQERSARAIDKVSGDYPRQILGLV